MIYIAKALYFYLFLFTLSSYSKSFSLRAGVTIGGIVVVIGGETVEPNGIMKKKEEYV